MANHSLHSAKIKVAKPVTLTAAGSTFLKALKCVVEIKIPDNNKMPQMYYTTEGITLEQSVWQGPATITQVDIVDAETALRPIDTLAWKKPYTEAAYDFPNSYVNIPLRVLTRDPISTYSIDQNNRFDQRYKLKK
jgi:hypothetical protein